MNNRTGNRRSSKTTALNSRRPRGSRTVLTRSKLIAARRITLRRRKGALEGGLEDLARRYGIQTSYQDVAGQRRKATIEALRAILEIFGISAGNDRAVREALREQAQRHWQRPLEPVIVLWDGKAQTVPLRLRADAPDRGVQVRLHLEDGSARRLSLDEPGGAGSRGAQVEGQAYHTRPVRIPSLPLGYHHLEVEASGRMHRSLVIAAPVRSYSPAHLRQSWGIFLPMHAAHSQTSWGGGNFSDWSRLCQWAGKLGASFTGTLPLLAAFLDKPLSNPSPYAPVSRLFWNEFYLDLEQIPELQANRRARQLIQSAAFQEKLNRFRQNRLIEYPEQMTARRRVLEILAAGFFRNMGARRKTFERFLQARPSVSDYAEFRAACDRAGSCWTTWEGRMRYGKLEKGDFDAACRDYHLYAQWNAQEQVQRLLAANQKRNVQLYLDLPLGVHPDGYDLWRYRDAFALEARVGAPPDSFFPLGQDWGFAPPHPQRRRESGYAYLLQYLRFQMRHTGLLRLDHVMGLHRLFWIPPRFEANEGVYVSYPAEELHAILSLESHRNQTVVVGENLGTVPPEVNHAMRRHGLREMYVVEYEQRPDPRRPLRDPPAGSIASLNTHDMPTFRSYWEGADIRERAHLKLIPAESVGAEQAQRDKLRQALLDYFSLRDGWPGGGRPRAKTRSAQPQAAIQSEEVITRALAACLKWLAASPAEMVMINLEDLWLESAPQNVPGTSTQCPNWCRKAALSLEEIERAPGIKTLLDLVQKARAGEGKGSP